jgi:glycosyltransferase involved in cell wall biosynthesis
MVTVVVPSLNHANFLGVALNSIAQQALPMEVFVLDAGSTDGSVEIIESYSASLAGWRSHPDGGQAASINEGIGLGTARYVTWVNSDDWLLPGALAQLVAALEAQPDAPAAYGRAWNVDERSGRRTPVWVEPFRRERLAQRCIICQPATLIRRSAWSTVGGLDPTLHMAMDYDLWWRLFLAFGPLVFVDQFLAANRDHALTKTRTQRARHYREAIAVVRRHNGRVPLKWWIAQPYAVWYRSLVG